MSRTRADYLTTLSTHERVVGVRDLRQHCSCGWESGERVGIVAHREHVADALAAVCRCGHDPIDHHGTDPADGCMRRACDCGFTFAEAQGWADA